MRSFISTVSLIGLVLYGLAVTGASGLPTAGRARAAGTSLTPLETALEATGARVETVRVAGWVEVHDARALAVGRQRLEAARVQGDTVQVQTPQRAGSQYLSVNWTLAGQAARQRWEAVAATVRDALGEAGASPMVTVQLEGTAAVAGAGQPDPENVAAQALESLSATDQQTWRGGASASIAAKTVWLPPSPLGVNVQAAARRDTETGRLRVWVAWPALIQEY